MRRAIWLLTSMLLACGAKHAANSVDDVRGPKLAPEAPLDSDHDGLCDSTEKDIGTDPHSADSDHDGLPDSIEIANGFDPTDASSPTSDEVATLEATPGSTSDFRVRVTIDGAGQGATGLFQSISSVYGDGTSADDFFVGTVAVEADPIDAARSVDTGGARFDAVLGHTRLTFSIRFEYPDTDAAGRCVRVYPFRYGVKGDDGNTQTERLFLLEVTPKQSGSQTPTYCLPLGCE